MKDKYQVIIIGAGPAGIFTAIELMRGGAQSVLLADMGRHIDSRKCPARTASPAR